jgi:tetratricopeptide (TPR) repeat protein
LTNKEKLLASAQKHLKKKLLPRAIKDFAKVVEIDPNDMRSRQKLAELYSRTGKSSEAFEQYETVAKCFAGNGFYLKAIAIYRQMQKLDPSQISIYARLAELNEKQGLIGNALAEYRQLVSHYEKNELTADAVRILEKMQGLDPENLNIRIKLAEVLTANGQVAEGREHFDASLKVLSDKQDFDRALKLYKKFLPLFPNDNAIQQGLAAVLLARGEHQKGFSLLQNLLRKTPDDPEILRMLAAAYRDAGDLNNSRLTYQHLLKLDASDLGLRESLVRCCLDGRHYEQALAELEEWKEAFQQAGRLETLKEFYEDLKQVLPDNRAVLQTLDSIYELTGDGDKLLDFMSSSSSADAYAVEEETVSDSLLDTAADDMEEDQILDLDEIEIPLGDGAAETGAEPADAGAETAEPEENVLELDISTALQLEAVEEDSLDLNFDFGEDAAEPPPGRDLQSELEEAEFYLQQGLFDEAERVCRELLAENPASEEGRRKLDDILLRRGGKEAERDASSELHDLAVEVLEEGFPELALDSLDNILGDEFAELDDLLDLSSAGPVFRTDVDDQIAADDMESHYNLGIAYREMGLFEDAIIEFGKAEADPARFVDCKTLKGLCYAARGEFEKSEASYMDALVSTSIDEGQRLSLQYELGMLYEAFQRPADALDSYKSVAGVDPQFRDVEEKIAALSASGGTPASSGSSKDRISFL